MSASQEEKWESIKVSPLLEDTLKQVEKQIDMLMQRSNLFTGTKDWSAREEGRRIIVLNRLVLDLKSSIKELKENGL